MGAAGAAAGALHRRRGGGQGRRRPGGDVGRRPWERLARRPGAVAVARPHLRLRVPLQGHVPLRARRRADQARPQQLRRHRHHLLLHLGGAVGCPRRGGPRVPGQRERAALHAAHQRVRQRQRQQGAAVPPLVRPHHRLPHLLHRVDASAHPRAGGRDADPGVQEPRGPGRAVPVVAADAPVRLAVGRPGLGHAGRTRQDGLVTGALRGAVPQLHGHRVTIAGGGVGQWVRAADGRGGAAVDEVGAGQLHGVRLLRGHPALPAGRPARVLHAVGVEMG